MIARRDASLAICMLFGLACTAAVDDDEAKIAQALKNVFINNGRHYQINPGSPLDPSLGQALSNSNFVRLRNERLNKDKCLDAYFEAGCRGSKSSMAHAYLHDHYRCFGEMFPCTSPESVIKGSPLETFFDNERRHAYNIHSMFAALLLMTEGLGFNNSIVIDPKDQNKFPIVRITNGDFGHGFITTSENWYDYVEAVMKILDFFGKCGDYSPYKETIEIYMSGYADAKDPANTFELTPLFLFQTFAYEYLLRRERNAEAYIKFAKIVFKSFYHDVHAYDGSGKLLTDDQVKEENAVFERYFREM